jgi:hypothetical protein
MALQVFDGFEIAPFSRNGWVGTVPTAQAGRTGGKAVSFGANGLSTLPLPTPAAQVTFGFAFRPSSGSIGSTGANCYIWGIRGDAAATGHMCMNIAFDGHLTLRRSISPLGTIIATSSAVISENVWHYLEVQATIADAGGICIVRLDGVEVINFVGDTKNAGTLTTVSSIDLGGIQTSYFDDFYALDGLGAAPYNTFLGDRVVKAMRPDGAGASTGFTPSAGANYQCVDEDPWTTADYVAAAAAATDLYTHSDVAGFSSVDAVQPVTYSLKTDAGVRTLRTVMRSNLGTSVESADLALPTSVGVIQGPIRLTDPDGVALTQALLNSAQYGVKAV